MRKITSKWNQNQPVKTARTNVIGMMNVLDLAKKQNARVLPASTSEGTKKTSHRDGGGNAGMETASNAQRRGDENSRIFFSKSREFILRICLRVMRNGKKVIRELDGLHRVDDGGKRNE